MSHSIVMYESRWCGFCGAARRLLESRGWPFDSIVVDGKPEVRAQMIERTGRSSVPQIFFGDTHVGGFDDLSELDSDGELDALYASLDPDAAGS